LANEQEANLDGDSDEVRQAFAASTVTAASVLAAGGAAAAAASVPMTATTKKVTKYCFIHGKRSYHTSHHTSAQCKMIELNLRAYPYDTTNTATFDAAEQVKKVKLTTSTATEVEGIGKGK